MGDLTDDQRSRLRQLAEQFGRARYAPAYKFTGNDLLALLDENDRLHHHITEQDQDLESLQRSLAEHDRLRGETTLLRERAAHAEQERDRLRSENAELSQMVDDKLCGCGDVLAEGAKCPNCMTADWVRYDAENERLRERIAALTETVRDVADVLQQDGRLRGALALRDACGKAEAG